MSKSKEYISCPGCGAIIKRYCYSSHQRTNKHKNNLKKSEEELELEKERNNIERIYNKKIRAMRRQKRRDLKKIDIRIQNLEI